MEWRAGVRIQRAGGPPNFVIYTADKLLIENCTLSQNVAGDDDGGVVNATGWRAAVLLNRVALQNNNGQRSLVTSEGGTIFSTQSGLQYFDSDASAVRHLVPAGPDQEDLFLDFSERWLADTVAVRRSQSRWPIQLLAAIPGDMQLSLSVVAAGTRRRRMRGIRQA